MPERTDQPEASATPEPFILPERQPPTRRRLLVVTWLLVVFFVIELPHSIWNLTQGKWLGGIGGLLAVAGLTGLLVHNFRELRKTPA